MLMFQKDWLEIENAPVDIWDIEIKVRNFYIMIEDEGYTPDDYRINLIKSMNLLISSKSLVKNLIVPEDNKYIKNEDESYKWMIDNLNRADLFLEDQKEKMIGQLENARVLNINISKSSKTYFFKAVLIEQMEQLVYYPLKKAYYKFSQLRLDEKGNKIKRDDKLFCYLLFIELYHHSESVGGIARLSLGGSHTQGFGTVNKHPTTSKLNLPAIPEGVITEENEVEKRLIEKANSLFNFDDYNLEVENV